MLHTLVLATTFHYGSVEQALFSVLMFCVFFVFYSFLVTNGFQSPPQSKTEKEELTRIDNFVREIKEAIPVETTTETTVQTLQTQPTETSQVTTTAMEDGLITHEGELTLETDEEIEQFVSQLNYRNARQVASQLKIKQKVNGNDKKLEQLKREIRQLLRKQKQLLSAAKQAIAA